MKPSLKPILYDFKRAMLRLSTLTLLLVFLLVGIGLSYLTYSSLGRTAQTLGFALAAVVGNDTCRLYGVVVDIKGNVVEDFELTIMERVVRERGFMVLRQILRVRLPGNLSISEPSICSAFERRNLAVEVSHKELRASSLYFLDRTLANGTKLYVVSGGIMSLSLIDGYGFLNESTSIPPRPTVPNASPRDFPELRFVVIIGAIGLDKWVDLYLSYIVSSESAGVRVEYFAKPLDEKEVIIDPTKANFTFLANLSSPVFTRIRLDIEPPMFVVFAINRGEIGFTSTSLLVERSRLGVEAATVNLITGQIGLGLFIQFFPVVILYLVYVLIAKPKSIGALEFVIARPVTRGDIYFTRLAASVLVVLTSTTIFMFALNASLNHLIGISLEPTPFIILYLGTLASLVTFLSLYYLVASWLRSGQYLGVSIALFLVFSLFWGLVVFAVSNVIDEGFAKTNLLISYFNPIGSIHYASYFVQKYYQDRYGLSLIDPGVDAVVNPVAVCLQPVVMTAAFIALGYVAFKKANLSQ